MNKEELKEYKKKLPYNLAQLELDYYQHLILNKLYEKFNTIYFKGGTCLQKCYGIKRFSEDLDFNYEEIKIKTIIEFIEKTFNTKIINYNKTPFGTSFSIRFQGILYDNNPQTQCKISFDFREGDTYQKKLKKIIRPIYHDLENYFLIALSEEEILAEKIRATITRYKARDIYDLNELLLQKTRINIELINKKLKTYNITFNKELLTKKIDEKEKIYEEEMSKLTKIYPSFKECKENIIKEFKNNL